MGLILVTYFQLPDRYRMKPDWQEAAVDMMIATVFIGVFSDSRWRRISFWVLLAISSSIHVVIVHAWTQRVGNLSRNQGKLAALLGFGLFYTFNALIWVLRRKFYGNEALDDT